MIVVFLKSFITILVLRIQSILTGGSHRQIGQSLIVMVPAKGMEKHHVTVDFFVIKKGDESRAIVRRLERVMLFKLKCGVCILSWKQLQAFQSWCHTFRKLFECDWQVQIFHIWREGNGCANSLASSLQNYFDDILRLECL